jgi:threonine/homoserine/homoserine lactone efflux protein
MKRSRSFPVYAISGAVLCAAISVWVQAASHPNIYLFLLVFLPALIDHGDPHPPLFVSLYLITIDTIIGTVLGVIFYALVNVLVKCADFLRSSKGIDVSKKGEHEK